jgi:hypothetical protein
MVLALLLMVVVMRLLAEHPALQMPRTPHTGSPYQTAGRKGAYDP